MLLNSSNTANQRKIYWIEFYESSSGHITSGCLFPSPLAYRELWDMVGLI